MAGKDRKEILKLLKLLRETTEREKGNGAPRRLDYIDTYIKLYSKTTTSRITQATFTECHKPRSEAPDLKNNVRGYIGREFRPFLEEFFKAKGNHLPYRLTIPMGRYYFELVKQDIVSQSQDTLSDEPEINTTGNAYKEETSGKIDYNAIFNKIEGKLIDFFKIIYHAYRKPTELVVRSKDSKFLKIDALVIFILAMVLVIAIFLHYLYKFNFPADLSTEVSLLEERIHGLLSPLTLIFSIFWIPIISLILWFPYRFFKGNATFPETLNFQFYFWSSWLPFLVIGLLADLYHRFKQTDNLLFSIIFLALFGYMVIRYFMSVNILMGLTHKKGILPFLVNTLITGIIVTLLF